MKTSVLRGFLIGEVSVVDLVTDLIGSRDQINRDTTQHFMVDDMTETFVVRPDHLIQLCDVVLAEQMEPEYLELIAFGMLAADCFEWDADSPPGDRVANTIYDWSAPELNYVLRTKNIRKFRYRLLTGEDTFVPEDTEGHSATSHRVVWKNYDT